MGGGKGSSPKAPPPIDPGKSMGEYLFGSSFGSAQGITDPVLQERLLSAERTYRPQYTALELADIGVMARGIESGTANPEYQRLQAQLAGARAAQESGMSTEQLEAQASRMFPPLQQQTGTTGDRMRPRAVYSDVNEAARQEFLKYSTGNYNAGEIAQLEVQLQNTPETLGGTPGLFDLLEEQSTRAGALQREQLGLQRADDVGALQEFAPQVVEAYRDADPYSTGLAEQQTAMADDLYQRSQGLNPEQQRLVDQQALGMAQRQGRVNDQSAIAGQLMGREQYLSGLRGQAAGMGQQAFNQNRLLAGDIGNTILGRASSAITLGGQSLSAAQRGAEGQMGPQLFDANAGYNAALQQRGQDMTFQGMQAQADAASSAGTMGAVSGIAQGLGTYAACWVAREVYGIENPKWLEFREWMLNDAPSWLRNLYLKYGERTAKFISNKPRVKSIIRKWMNTKIK